MFHSRTHIENWVLFWNEVEKIKKLQVIAEFTDNDDKSHEPSPAIIQSPNNSDYDESDSDNTPRSTLSPPLKSNRKNPRTNGQNPKSSRRYDTNDNVVINLEDVLPTRDETIQSVKQTFKQNFNNSDLRTDIEDIEAHIDETLGDLSKEIHSNLKNKNE